MATTYTVTTSFSADTTAIASEVNQNFTDVLTALNALDAANLTGTIALARISNLTSSQMASTYFKDEDDMASDSATAVSSQQAIKAHVTASSTDDFSPTTMSGASDSTGTVTFPNGFIRKWGKETRTGTNTTVTFATAFPNACFQAFACGGKAATQGAETQTHTITAASFKIYTTSASASPMRWFAIGR